MNLPFSGEVCMEILNICFLRASNHIVSCVGRRFVNRDEKKFHRTHAVKAHKRYDSYGTFHG